MRSIHSTAYPSWGRGACARRASPSRRPPAAHGAQPLATVWRECEQWVQATFEGSRPLVWAAHNGRRFDEPILRRCVGELGVERRKLGIGAVAAQ